MPIQYLEDVARGQRLLGGFEYLDNGQALFGATSSPSAVFWRVLSLLKSVLHGMRAALHGLGNAKIHCRSIQQGYRPSLSEELAAAPLGNVAGRPGVRRRGEGAKGRAWLRVER